jgi:hypothetical protein
MKGELIDEGRFAGSRRTSRADQVGFASVLEELVEPLLAFGTVVFNLSEQTRQC